MDSSKQIKRWTFIIGFLICLFTFFGFCFSRLSFAPVPWPDGSAFYLPSIDLFSWPPRWRMHAQAAFVPSYDYANFNLMPALPFLLGLADKLRISQFISAAQYIKVVSSIAQIIWAYLIWNWVNQSNPKLIWNRKSVFIATILALSALWDPIVRWGTFVVRTETWIGLCWTGILIELWKNPKNTWKISAFLAASAYFHFEAIILVPAVAVAYIPKDWRAPGFFQSWIKDLFSIGIKTLVFLSPWLVYVLVNFSLFIEQMNVQFFRLAGKNNWIANPYLLFHSLFIEHGSPLGVPKFFNFAKVVFWLLIILLTANFIHKFIRTFIKNQKNEHPFPSLLFANFIAFWGSFYLWCTKAEVWFVTLCHLTFWTWIVTVVLLELKNRSSLFSKTLLTGSGIYAGFSLFGLVVQSQQIQPSYNWEVYLDWINCIDRRIQAVVHTSTPKIWQPHVPDILVELANKHPNYDLTRALDFNERLEQAFEFGEKVDVLLLSDFFDVDPKQPFPTYAGPVRDADLIVQRKVPFGSWSLNELPQKHSQNWQTSICHFGPFWAAILTK